MSSTNEAIASPDTGALVTDLEALLSSMRDNFSPSHRSAMLGMLTELDDEGAESLRSVIFRWGKDLVQPLVLRARARNELGEAPVPSAVLALPLDLARHELAMRGVLSDDRITAIVHTIVLPLMDVHTRAPVSAARG